MEMHEGHIGGHYGMQTIVKKLLVASYWWPNMQKAIAKMCQTYEICEHLRSLNVMRKSPLHLVMSFEPFLKWVLISWDQLNLSLDTSKINTFWWQQITLRNGLKQNHYKITLQKVLQNLFMTHHYTFSMSHTPSE